MEIKIGFTDSQRELSISSDTNHDEVVAQISQALTDGSELLDLQDDRGRRYLVRSQRISYVEIGSSATRAVGFAPGA